MTDRAEAVSRQVDILRSTGELSPAAIEAIGIRLQEYAEEAAKPVFVRVLLGMAGWSAAIFLILSVQLVVHEKGLLPFGIVLLIAAVGLARAGKTIFSSQLVLALAFAGNIGILTGAASVIPGNAWFVILILQFFLCLAFYPLLPVAAFRFAAPVSVAVLAVPWIVERDALWLFHLLVAAELILFLALSLRHRRIPAFFPLEKAALLLLPATLLAFHLFRIASTPSSATPLWPSGLLLCGALLVILFHPVFGIHLPSSWKLGLSAASLLGLFTSPGILASLLLLLLGRSRGECCLTVLGGLFLPLFLGFYYYELDMDLAHKTWLIAGSGLLLVGIRRLTAHSRPGGEMP